MVVRRCHSAIQTHSQKSLNSVNQLQRRRAVLLAFSPRGWPLKPRCSSEAPAAGQTRVIAPLGNIDRHGHFVHSAVTNRQSARVVNGSCTLQ